MSDTFTTVVAIGLTAVLIFIFPVITMAERIDTASQTDIETITSEFINEIKITGKLTRERYNKFLQNLNSTGNIYDVNLEFKILDENPGKKSLQTTTDKIGENVYYSVYTTQIENQLNIDKEGNVYNLKEGDIVSATVRNTNLTLAQQMKNFFYKVVGSDVYTIQASQTGLVTSTGSAIE